MFAAVFFLLGTNSAVFAQDLDIKITVDSSDPTLIQVEGKFLKESGLQNHNWVFRKTYANTRGLAERIRDLELYDAQGQPIKTKKFAAGEFLAETRSKSFKYSVDLGLTHVDSAAAHVSWIEGSHGLVMLNDLLPQFDDIKLAARIIFELPVGWKVTASEKISNDGAFLVEDTKNAVFLVGNGWRELNSDKALGGVKIFSLGQWQFEDAEIVEMANGLVSEYSRLFKTKAIAGINIFLLPFPKPTPPGRWQAETRGRNITIISASMPFKNQALQRLHEQLRHEIFHLWIPNRLNLIGNYAWFYEGFAVYQALKTGVWLGQIRFEDFLSTLGQAYDLHIRTSSDTPFIAHSGSNSGNDSASVYSKGLLVAFLTDIAILRKSQGREDIAAIFRELPFDTGPKRILADANQLLLQMYSTRTELTPIAENYIKGSSKIDLSEYLNYIGVENRDALPFARLRVKPKLTRREKALLNKLGYTRWRKFIKRPR